MNTKKRTDSKNKTHGALLQDLKEWIGGSVKIFCTRINFSEKWYYETIKDEIIPKQSRIEISRALNIEVEYWDGKLKLPLHPLPISNTSPNGTTREQALENKISEYQTKYITALEKIESLHEEVIRLRKEHENS